MTQQNKDNSVEEQVDRPRAIILSPQTGQPRYHRRAAMLIKAGYDVKVYFFNPEKSAYNISIKIKSRSE